MKLPRLPLVLPADLQETNRNGEGNDPRREVGVANTANLNIVWRPHNVWDACLNCACLLACLIVVVFD